MKLKIYYILDWLVWLIHTQKASNLELDALMDGINLYLPKIEVKRWPKSRLVFGGRNSHCRQFYNCILKLYYFLPLFLPWWAAVNALLKCSPHEKLHQKYFTCIQSLTWDIPGRYTRNFRRWRFNKHFFCNINILNWKDARTTRVRSLRTSKKAKIICCVTSQSPRKRMNGPKLTSVWKSPVFQTLPWLGNSGREKLGFCHRAPRSLSLLNPSSFLVCIISLVPLKFFNSNINIAEDVVEKLKKSRPTMMRGLLYKGATQGLHCEMMKAKGIRDIRQPAFSKIVCGMLNVGGGDIWVGLGNASKVEGVLAHRAERDSFSQGLKFFCNLYDLVIF